jgi:predicted transcriptional regulator of viral defense system
MEFAALLDRVGTLPMFRGSLLLVGDQSAADVRRQLSRWTAAGKVVQLRRNVYVLASPWRKVEPHHFLVANELHRPSYVSLESALAYHGLIPEHVPVTTSVTTARPVTVDTPLGRHLYRHVGADAFFGYERIPLLTEQDALVATPEKALLDLVYLTAGGDAVDYLESLRLEGLDALDVERIREYAERWNKPKVRRAADRIVSLAHAELPA